MARQRNQIEAVEQAKVIAWAQENIARWPALAFLFHTPNGGARNAVVAMQLKAMGVRRGVPDLMLPLHTVWHFGPLETHKHGLAIEMKVVGGKMDHEQVRWCDWLVSQGWRHAVCYSAQEAIDTIAAYLQGQTTVRNGDVEGKAEPERVRAKRR